MYVVTEQSYWIRDGHATDRMKENICSYPPLFKHKHEAYDAMIALVQPINRKYKNYDTDGTDWIEYEWSGRYFTLKVYALTFEGPVKG